MTDEELLAEVQAMRQGGNRGEAADAEGTPEGTYLWKVAHQEPLISAVFRSVEFRTSVEYTSAFSPEFSPTLSIGATSHAA